MLPETVLCAMQETVKQADVQAPGEYDLRSLQLLPACNMYTCIARAYACVLHIGQELVSVSLFFFVATKMIAQNENKGHEKLFVHLIPALSLSLSDRQISAVSRLRRAQEQGVQRDVLPSAIQITTTVSWD